jgi:hypothetical protein
MKKNPLTDNNAAGQTGEKGVIDIATVEAQTRNLFAGDILHDLPTGELPPVPGKIAQEIKRPRMEMPHADYQKLKIICDLVNEDISKMLYRVVKTWLDSVHPKI